MPNSGRGTQIIVALITTIGALGAAIITSWDKIQPQIESLFGKQENNENFVTDDSTAEKQVTKHSIAGEWTWPKVGKVTFKQEGEKVTGLVNYNNPPGMTANIEGTLKGQKLNIIWYFTADPNGKQNPQGSGVLELSSNGKKMTGHFTERTSPKKMLWLLIRDDQEKKGMPTSVDEATDKQVAKPSIAGEWTWPKIGKVTFKQKGEKVTGLVNYNNPPGMTATIEGTLKGQKLDIIWYFTADPKGKQNPQGSGVLELSSDGKRMTGHFTERTSPNKIPWLLIR